MMCKDRKEANRAGGMMPTLMFALWMGMAARHVEAAGFTVRLGGNEGYCATFCWLCCSDEMWEAEVEEAARRSATALLGALTKTESCILKMLGVTFDAKAPELLAQSFLGYVKSQKRLLLRCSGLFVQSLDAYR